jgi:hypothetical protein
MAFLLHSVYSAALVCTHMQPGGRRVCLLRSSSSQFARITARRRLSIFLHVRATPVVLLTWE